MLRKLMKHEIRATAAPVLIVCAVLLAIGAITRLFYALAPLTEDFYDVFYVIAMLLNTFQMFGLSAAGMFITVFIAFRFYNNVYGNEGYCTLMLPVPRSSIIVSKMLVDILWIVLCYAAFALSLVISGAGVTDENVVVIYAEMFEIYGNAFGALDMYLEVHPAVYIAELIVLIVISIFGTVLPIFCAISIGQLFKKHRILGSVAAYFGISTILQTFTVIFVYAYAIGITIFIETSVLPAIELTWIVEMIVQVGIIVFLALYAIVTAAQYFITKYIMKNAVNLQ